MCACMCVCVCTHVCDIHVLLSMCMWKPEDNAKCPLSPCPSFSLENRTSHWMWRQGGNQQAEENLLPVSPSPYQHWGYRHPGPYDFWGSELRSLFMNGRHCCPLSISSASQTYSKLLAAKNPQSDCTDYGRSVLLSQFSHLFLGRSSHTDHAEHCYCAE